MSKSTNVVYLIKQLTLISLNGTFLTQMRICNYFSFLDQFYTSFN